MFNRILIVIIINLSLLTTIHASEKLIFAIDIIRHGDRTPLIKMSTVNYEWKLGLGQLTPTGIKQEHELGQRLRHIYIDQYHLLPDTYQPATMYVRSTDIDRTLMSAESLLFGLYKLQPIPIHTIPYPEDTLLAPDNQQYKPNELLQKYIIPSAEWQAKNDELKPHYVEWSSALGIEIKELSELIAVADALYVNQLYQIPTPIGLSEVDAQQIIAAGQWAMVTIYKNATLGKITGSALLTQMISQLQHATTDSSLKYVLYSAHDSTLMTAMTVMGAPLNDVPPYASNLTILLFDSGNQNYIVRVKYNDNPVTIRGCDKDFCRLDQFARLAD